MFPFATREQIDLAAPSIESSKVSTDAEKHELRNVAEIEADASTVAATVFSNLVPNKIRLVCESPCAHHAKSISHKSVRDPQIEVALLGSKR